MQLRNWAQRSKARSLAITIGVAGIVASTLLIDISAPENLAHSTIE